MKRIGSVVLCCVGVAAIGASVALAGNSTPNPRQVAAKLCTGELHAMGVKSFKQLYGDNAPKYQHAMRNCQRSHRNNGGNVLKNAAQQCRDEQSTWDPAQHGGMTFEQTYGTNGNDKNAFGKCVSSKVQSTVAQEQENLQNAAQTCRAERSSIGGDAFRDKYGTNKKNKKNAFGKCVSKTARGLNTP